MRRSATVLREGTRVSATGIARAERKTISPDRKASSQAFAAHIRSTTLEFGLLRATNCYSALAIRKPIFMQ